MIEPRPALFVQPHYDDAALSCGGTIAAFARAGFAPAVITVFASEVVDSMVGDFAAWKHARWQLTDVDQVVATRRDEDARAAAILGAGLRWLGLPDAIYRDRYASDAQLYGSLHPDEMALADHLAEELAQLPEWRPGNAVFVPLAVGSHVDHLLVFEAGLRLAARGFDVWAYEDLPYAIHTPQGVAARLAQARGHTVEGEDRFDIAATLDAKLDAIACYASQLPVIFRFTDDFRCAMAAHAASAADGRPAERFWRLRGT